MHCSLNESVPYGLGCFNMRSPVGGTVWEGLGGASGSMPLEVEFKSLDTLRHLQFSLYELCLWLRMWLLGFLIPTAITAMLPIHEGLSPFWNCKPK